MSKKMVTDYVPLSNYTSASALIKDLQGLVEKYGDGDVEAYEEYDCSCLRFEYKRPETDAEEQYRVAQEKAREGYERQTYERLKLKFENS